VAIVLLREPDHRIDYFNPAFTELFPPEEWAGPLLGHTLAEVYPRIKLAGLVELLDQVFATGESQAVIEMPLEKLQPGSPRYVTFAYQAYREEGRTVGVAAFVYDVTEQVLARRRNEALQAKVLANTLGQVRQREELYQVFEQAPVVVALLRGPEHFFHYRNPAFQALFPGRPLVGRLYGEAMPEIVAAGLMPALDRVYATGEPFYGTALPVVTTPSDGAAPHLRYYDFSYHSYREEGQPAGVSIFAYDVTEQVWARQQREAQQQELRRIFEQAPVAITIMRGQELNIELTNAAILAMWGRTAAQVLGQPYFEAVPDTAGQGYEEILGGVMTTGQPLTIAEAPVQLDRAHTGQPTLGYFNFTFQPHYDAQQQVSGLIAIGTEATAQVLARQQVQALNEELAAINEQMQATNEQLNETNAQLTCTNADLDTFVYAASHDLKAPIANIEGLVEALRDYLPADHPEPMVPRMLGMIDGAVTRFQQTVGHLTDVSRLQQPGQLPAEELVLADVVEGVCLDLAALLESTRAQLLLVPHGVLLGQEPAQHHLQPV
jgi:signal transduction histidine kinase